MENSTAIIPSTDALIETELQKITVSKEELQALVDLSKDFVIKGVDDKQGIAQVHDHRMLLRDKRLEIEKGAKLLRDNATRFSKAVSARENEYIDIIYPEEERLKEKEDWVKVEKERIRMDEERKKAEALQSRIEALRRVDADHDIIELQIMPDEVFTEILEMHTQIYNNKKAKDEEARLRREEEAKIEKKRLDDEAKINKRTMDRVNQLLATGLHYSEDHYISPLDGIGLSLEAVKTMTDEAFSNEIIHAELLISGRRKKEADQKAEFNRKKAEQERELAELTEAREKLAKEKAAFEAKQKAAEDEKKRVEELEAAKKKAAEYARIEAEARIKREQDEKAQADLQAAARKKQEESELPDKEKLQALGQRLFEVIRDVDSTGFDTKKGFESYSAARDQISEAITTWLIPAPQKAVQ